MSRTEQYFLAAIFVVVSISACSLLPPTKISPVTGRVLDHDTGQPVAGAIVVVRWIGTATKAFVDQHTACYHVETAKTDAEGIYETTSWLEASKYQDLGFKGRRIMVYKAGYRHIAGDEGGMLYLEKERVAVDQRLEYLLWLSGYLSCGSWKNQHSVYTELYEAMYQEALSIAANDARQRKVVNSLKYNLDVVKLGWEEAHRRRLAGAYSE